MQSWLYLTLISGVLLGFYDISKKKALQYTSVFKVLATYTLFSFVFVSYNFKISTNIERTILLLIILKSFAVYLSWICNFMAFKRLPISIVAPFHTLIPIFTMLFGVSLLGERFPVIKLLGIAVMLASYYVIGKTGKEEMQSHFEKKYIFLILGNSLFSSLSAILDRIILKSTSPTVLQFWFCFFMALFFFITLALLYIKKSTRDKTTGKLSVYILLMSLLLVISDRVYFTATGMEDAQISIIIPVRNISILVSSIIGGLIFKEKNLKVKMVCTVFILMGICILFM